eukprot:238514_1
MNTFISIMALLITTYGQTFSPTPAPTSCICTNYVINNSTKEYTKSDGSGCVSGDDICAISCDWQTGNCECGKNAWCDLVKDIAEGLGTILIVIIVICVVCGLCCIGGIIYCVCAGALCCAAAAGGNKGNGHVHTSAI